MLPSLVVLMISGGHSPAISQIGIGWRRLLSTLLKRPQYIFVLLVACLGLALSVAAFTTVQAGEQHQLEEHFEQLGDGLTDEREDR